MDDITDENRFLIQIQQDYVNFLDDGDVNGHGLNIDNIKTMIADKNQRLYVSLNELRDKYPERCARLLENGFQEMPAFHRALREVVTTVDSDYANQYEEFFVGLEGSFGRNHVTPRTLAAHFLGSTVCVEGIVTKCSLINPKIVRSLHYCPATKKISERRYADTSNFDVMPTSMAYPKTDEEGNLLETEFGLSKYRDHQTISIQEMPEKAPTGQLPRSLDIVLDNDLVDVCKPGDRVLIVGVYRCNAGKQNGYTTGIFRSTLIANNVTILLKDVNTSFLIDELETIRRFSRTPNVFNIIAKSLAPSIHGHDYIKKALLCLLLGGVEKILPNGTRLRGDINVLLIGDPSVAKSQMLRYVSNVAPRVVMTTGRGSSGVGLTAAVTTDHETGDRRLEAGAMVLADRGIVCIDEFDKMSDADRTAIHEVMEQGKVTIAKAGIHARLNARTSVLAAANPLYGRYDSYKTPMENIGLQDSLLSRFDLLFIVKDVANPDSDRLIADHVLRMHRYRNPAEQDGDPTPIMNDDMILTTLNADEEKKTEKKLEPYEKHDPLLHGRYRTRGDKVLSIEFIKKYIAAAKNRKMPPQITPEASAMIAQKYTELREKAHKEDKESRILKTQPITARCLETLIRLASAHAKGRFGNFVTKEDALAAIELLQFAIFEKVDEKESKKRKVTEDYNSDEEMDDGDGHRGENGDAAEPRRDENGDGEENGNVENGGVGNAAKRLRPSVNGDENTPTGEEEMDVDPNLPAPPSPDLETGEITDERFERFQPRLSEFFVIEGNPQSLATKKIMDWFVSPEQEFTRSEVMGGLQRLITAEVIMMDEGQDNVFLIT